MVDAADMNVSPHAMCWKSALGHLAEQLPRLKGDKAFEELLNCKSNAAQLLMDSLGSLMLERDATQAVASSFRPILLHLVTHVVQGCGAGGDHQPEPSEVLVALAKLLPIAPHVRRPILRYVEQHMPPLETVLGPQSDDLELSRSVLSLFRLVPEASQRWSWAPLLDQLSHQDVEMRWVGVEAAALLFDLGDSEVEQLAASLMDSTAVMRCVEASEWSRRLGRLQDLEMWEPRAAAAGEEEEEEAEESLDLPVPEGHVEICGLHFPKRSHGESGVKKQRQGAASSPRLVITPTMQRNLRSASLALSMGWPLLLEGPPGSGKSTLIEHLAATTGNAADMVRIHLDDQMDSKSLLGAYVCTETPGEFAWQPGPLTEAMTSGRWLVVEDINLAPPDVLAALLPLLETGHLHLPQRAEVITAQSGFQMLCSITTAPGGAGAGAYSTSTGVEDLLGGLLVRVAVESPTTEETTSVLADRFPDLEPMLKTAVDMLMLVRRACGQADASEQSYDAPAVVAALDSGGLLEGASAAGASELLRLGRHLSLRELVKWGHRLCAIQASLIRRSASAMQRSTGHGIAKIPAELREAAFVEAADVFGAMLATGDAARKLLKALAALWGVPLGAVEQYLALAKPSLEVHDTQVDLGRASLPRSVKQESAGSLVAAAAGTQSTTQQGLFTNTSNAMRLLERVAVSLQQNEPLLLVGETGTGKTTMVQQLAQATGAELVVLNLSQQTDSSDLLGGFRPVEVRDSWMPLVNRFQTLFSSTWPRGDNQEFLNRVNKYAKKSQWKSLRKAFKAASDKVTQLASGAPAGKKTKEGAPKKKRRAVSPSVLSEWGAFKEALTAAEKTATAAESGFAFAFVEGALIRALRQGQWLLLDEINLAPPEALERIAGLLEDGSSSITLAERGDVSALVRHPSFRLLAAMNPATDAGKRDLPAAVRNRFTEVYTPELTAREDLQMLITRYLSGIGNAEPPVDALVSFYLEARQLMQDSLQDGAGQKPSFNLRTLCRALEYVRKAVPVYGLVRSLHDGLSMSFCTLLEEKSAAAVKALLHRHVPEAQAKGAVRAPPRPDGNFVLFEEFWLEAGPEDLPESRENDGSGKAFVESASTRGHLRNLARALLLRKYPILLQGPTSSGKTSLVAYLAAQTGHRFVRINNHEQTDLQEYLGSYVTDESGRLAFNEGVLVQAVRHGWWIVLDELNLAPTEVLEALNRLLDDNRELYVPELQETVVPHPHFMLFATQNPPGLYQGRKQLSRAFRSRFLELHVDQVPDSELVTIIERRCCVAPSHAKALVAVQHELIVRRTASNFFAGKHGFITPRDLFRWAERGAVSYQELAENGYLILGERLREPQEHAVVAEVLERCLRGAKLDMPALYAREGEAPIQQLEEALRAAREAGHEDALATAAALQGVVWTVSMRRMYTLLERSWRGSEPALLVGQTGAGKTTVCQMAALMRSSRLHIINCNQHTEASDFLGGFRPVRDRQRCVEELRSAAAKVCGSPLWEAAGVEPPEVPPGAAAGVLCERALKASEAALQLVAKSDDDAEGSVEELKSDAEELTASVKGLRAPFVWVDGPLVEAMRRGDCILVDEINLAEDAVLERLNSVLEPGRTLTLAEKGGEGAEVVTAAEGFRIVATMNPGGDYGKKELSPALSNRFTSIWVPGMQDDAELKAILDRHLVSAEVRELCSSRLMEFWSHVRGTLGSKMTLSPRDLLAWAHFINSAAPSLGALPAYVHGAYLTLLDGIGLGLGMSPADARDLKKACHSVLLAQLPDEETRAIADMAAGAVMPAVPLDNSTRTARSTSEGCSVWQVAGSLEQAPEGHWGVAPFFVPCGPEAGGRTVGGSAFDLRSPTTARNAMRVLRALQLRKPVLLEGSPGVGKTSLVAALAAASGHKLVRVNLSEHTDMMDLLGADLPAEVGEPGDFRWADGPLLTAIKSGAWVLLDELNLAGQSVLEGLNALLDHRSEVFIPELGTSFRCPASFRLFAAQNPLQEGGGRKGLPRSFLNRFSRVYMDLLEAQDLHFIASNLHPSIPSPLLVKMVSFLSALSREATARPKPGRAPFAAAGGPWEFNLRDLLRWCELVEGAVQAPTRTGADAAAALPESGQEAIEDAAEHFVQMLFAQRLRESRDRSRVAELWDEAMGVTSSNDPTVSAVSGTMAVELTSKLLRVGRALLHRGGAEAAEQEKGDQGALLVPGPLHLNAGGAVAGHGLTPLQLLPDQLPYLESACHAVASGWMTILAGPASTGKTSVARMMALLAGRTLHELSLTASSDTSDLLGGFEQVDTARRLRELMSIAQELVQRACKAVLCFNEDQRVDPDAMEICEEGPARMGDGRLGLLKSLQAHHSACKKASSKDAAEQIGLLKELASFLCTVTSDASLDYPGIASMQPQANALLEAAESIAAESSRGAGRFEWVDGALLRAMEKGEWVLLDNANMCNPTVLDRLNPLLEPGGELYLNECGAVGGNARVIRPAAGFRLILVLDPRHGEVSRAMRNRGVELFILPPEQQQQHHHGPTLLPDENKDDTDSRQDALSTEKWALSQEGVPGSKQLSALANAHFENVKAAVSQHQRVPGCRELRNSVRLAIGLMQRGWPVQMALQSGHEIAYHGGQKRAGKDSQAEAAPEEPEKEASSSCLEALEVPWAPCRWPSPVDAQNLTVHSRPWRVLRDGSVLESLAIQLGVQADGPSGQELEQQEEELHPAGVFARALRSRCAAGGKEITAGLLSYILFAAECFAERATIDDRKIRKAWVADTLQGLQETIATSPLESEALSVGCKVVKDLLESDLASSIFQEHEGILRSPGGSRLQGMLTLSGRQTAELVAPWLKESPSGASLADGAIGSSALLNAGKLMGAGAAVRWAALRSAREISAPEAVKNGTASVFQVAVWRYNNPRARARTQPAHPVVDVLHPLLTCLEELEAALVAQPGQEGLAVLRQLQQWRTVLWLEVEKGSLGPASDMTSDLAPEMLAYVWTKLRKAISQCQGLEACPDVLLPSGTLPHISREVDGTFGMRDGPPPKPLAWHGAGHAHQAATLELASLHSKLEGICSFGRLGYSPALPHYALQEESLDSRIWELMRKAWTTADDDTDCVDDEDEEMMDTSVRESKVGIMNAILACDPDFRQGALKALCLISCGSIATKDSSSVMKLVEDTQEMLTLMEDKITAAATRWKAGSWSAEESEELPADCIGWQDEDVVSMSGRRRLPQLLPPELMKLKTARRMQGHLASLADVAHQREMVTFLARLFSGAASQALGSGGLSSGGALEAAAMSVLDSGMQGCLRAPSELAPNQQAVWLLQSTASGAAAADEAAKFLPNTLHELVTSWHKALWDHAQTGAAAHHGGHSAHAGSRGDGMRPASVFQAFTTTQVSSLLSGSRISILERPARLLQLKLAARALKQTAPSPGARGHQAPSSSMQAADVTHGVSQAVQLLACMRHSLPSTADREELCNSLKLFLEHCSSGSSRTRGSVSQDIHSLVMQHLSASEHPWLKDVLQSLVSPFVSAALHAADDPENAAARGRMWALLGCMRLVLVQPPPGVDPAGKHQSKRTALDLQLRHEVEPHLAVRKAMDTLPGGPSESSAISDLENRRNKIASESAALLSKCVARPEPPMYTGLQAEVSRLMGGIGNYKKVLAMVKGLEGGAPGAAVESSTWQDTVLAWSERMAANYPLYVDILHPVRLALYETCYGVEQLRSAKGKQPHGDGGAVVDMVAAGLMAFPPVLGCSPAKGGQQQQQQPSGGPSAAWQPVPVSRLGDSSLQTVLGSLAKSSARSHQQPPVDDEQKQRQKDAQQVASYTGKLSAMRAALGFAALEAITTRSHGALSTFLTVLHSLLAAWEELKAAEAAAEEEEAQLFRTKNKLTTVDGVDDEAEAEADYQKAFPSHSAMFSDLEAMADPDYDPQESAARDAEGTGEASKAEARSTAARTLLSGDFLNEIVALHREVFMSFQAQSAAPPSEDAEAPQMPGFWQAAWDRSYKLGGTILSQSLSLGQPLVAAVDDAAAGGHLMALAKEQQKLTAKPLLEVGTQMKKKKGKKTKGDKVQSKAALLNMQEPRMEETALVQAPLEALLARLDELLEEWPDHPLLGQLRAICCRAMTLPLDSPLKAVLTGLELLLQQAQVWEETAAKHVSLGALLGQVAALAQRWRKLELESWEVLLDRVASVHADGAHSSWFHLFRILIQDSGAEGTSPAEAAVLAEQFLQTSTTGEFARRLSMLEAFGVQLDAHAREEELGQGGAPGWCRTLAVSVSNVRAYYGQFLEAADQRLSADRAPLEKDLADFVKLAKWEDRGFYSLKQSGERAHRKLHKICRKFEDALKQPVARIIANVTAKMGLSDIAANPEHSTAAAADGDGDGDGSDPAPGAQPNGSAHPGSPCWDKMIARCSEDATAPLLLPTGGADKALVTSSLRLNDASLYQHRLGSLLGRMGRLISDSLSSTRSGSLPLGAEDVDDLAGSIAARAKELRSVNGKGARALKKKALTDMLRALSGIGLSRHRKAVPQGDREVSAWFRLPLPQDGAIHPDGCSLGTWADAGGVEPGVMSTAEALWTRADSYYFRNISRVQRLWQAAKAPHPDLSGGEVQAFQRFAEHVLYLQRKQRRTLRSAWEVHDAILHVMQLTDSIGSSPESIPRQRATLDLAMLQKAHLDSIATASTALSTLASAVAEVETAPLARDGSAVLRTSALAAAERLTRCKRALDSELEVCTRVPRLFEGKASGLAQFATQKLAAVLIANGDEIASVHSELCRAGAESVALSSWMQPGQEPLPGWDDLCGRVLKAAEDTEAASKRGSDDQEQRDASGPMSELSAAVESSVQSVLLWAQSVKSASAPPPKKDEDEEEDGEAETMPEWEALLESKLAISRATVSAKQGARALSAACQAAEALEPGSPAMQNVRALLMRVKAVLEVQRAAVAETSAHFVSFHKATCKLGYIMTSVMATLIGEGFCIAEEDGDGDGEGDGEGDGQFKEAEGTGLGEGEGAKDVSDQIENEDQVLGAEQQKDDEDDDEDQDKPEEKGPKGDKEEKPDGIEMEEDFDGELEDLSEDEEREDGEEPEQDDGEQLDEQMGDTEGGDVVDERLWEDGDEKEEGQGEEKRDNNKTAQVEDKSQLEYDAGGEDDDQKDDKQQDQKNDKDQDQKDDKQADKDQEPEDDKEGGEDQEGPEGEVNAMEYEDQHHVQPEAKEEDFNLPEDMALDGEDHGDDEGNEGEEDEGGKEAGEDEQQGGEQDAGKEEAMAEDGEKDDPGGDEGVTEVTEPAAEEDPEKNQEGEEGEDGKEEKEAEEPPPGQPMDTGNEDEPEAPPEEDQQHFGGHEDNGEQPESDMQPEAGPEGVAADVPDSAAANASLGASEPQNDDKPDEGRGDAAEQTQAMQDQAAPEASLRQQQRHSTSVGVAEAGAQGAAQQDEGGGGHKPPKVKKPPEPNPFRNLGNAMEHWKAKLAVNNDAPPEEDGAGGEEDADADEARPEAAEYEFLGSDAQRKNGDSQALAPATEDQAEQMDKPEAEVPGEDAEEGDDVAAEEPQEDEPMEEAEEGQESRPVSGHAPKQWGGNQQTKKASEEDGKMKDGKGPGDDDQGKEEQDADEEERAEPSAEERHQDGSYVGAAAPAGGSGDGQEDLPAAPIDSLTPEEQETMRSQLDTLLVQAQEGGAVQIDAEREAYGQQVWRSCEALTAGLSAELTEQLRLILEPSMASRLAGEYRTGKRINMKKVIAYIASNFRKDKIWMRRTRPDKRRYQVVVAIDDSKSMSENGCGNFALESLTMICQAMSRVEVGELGVISFGGGGAVTPLHPLERPFSSANGPALMSALRFDRDNTIADKPMGELLGSLEHILDTAAQRVASQSHGGTAPSLRQLVLLLADGRFHEKEALIRHARELCGKPGVLVAFVALDTASNSLLDMKSVSFTGGKPVFTRYMDSFPFPFYVVLRDITALPQTLANLLRQWFQMCS